MKYAKSFLTLSPTFQSQKKYSLSKDPLYFQRKQTIDDFLVFYVKITYKGEVLLIQICFIRIISLILQP